MEKKFSIKKSKQRCKKYRERILDISQTVRAMHAAGAFSALELVDVIYYGLMKKNKNIFLDTFVMSKGHGCMSQYAVLENLGILKKKYLDNYCTKDGKLGCHPDYGLPGIEASTGSAQECGGSAVNEGTSLSAPGARRTAPPPRPVSRAARAPRAPRALSAASASRACD